MQTTEYYSAVKRNDELTQATTWTDLKDMVLSERSQTQNRILYGSVYVKYLELANPQGQKAG